MLKQTNCCLQSCFLIYLKLNNMNYEAHYNTLIERAKTRLLEGYGEQHHIVPRCLGGGDDADNMVRLTAEEHYVAHQLLVKIHPGHRGLAYAALLMSTGHLAGRSKNKSYGWLRARYSESCKGRTPWNKGKKLPSRSAEWCANISSALVGRTDSEETKARKSAAAKGRVFTKEHKAKIGAAHKGMKRSDEARQRMSVAQTGKKLSAETKAKMSLAKSKPRPWMHGKPAHNTKQIIIDGTVYASRTEAAKLLHKDRTTIYNWIRNGKAMSIEVTE